MARASGWQRRIQGASGTERIDRCPRCRQTVGQDYVAAAGVSPDACTSENEETEEEEFEHKDMDDKDAAVDESSAAEANREAVTPAAPLLSSSARDFASSSVHASSSRSISSSMVSTASTCPEIRLLQRHVT